MNDNVKYEIKYLTGHVEYQPVKYSVTKTIRYKILFFLKCKITEYYVESEFCKIGPFSKYEEALQFKLACEK